MTDDLVKRLRDACDGHPHAKIAWPHYILHEAASALESLSAENAALKADIAIKEKAIAESARLAHKLMTRALTAEAQRNGAYERAAKVADELAAEADRFASQAHAEGADETAKHASERAEHYREVAAAIRNLSKES